MTRRNAAVQCAVVIAVAIAVAFLPLRAGNAVLGDVALALLVAGPAAGASLAVASGRPTLGMSALASGGGYVAALLAVHGHEAPLDVGLGTLTGAVEGAVLALLGARLGAAGFIALGLVAATASAALVGALPRILGADAGLGPVAPLGVTLPDGRIASLTIAGSLHAADAVAAFVTLIAIVAVATGRGARWRAVGGDRERAAATGVMPLLAEVEVLALAGAIAGFCGAVAAHIAGIMTTSGFGPEAASVPLAAALIAGRAGPGMAAALAVLEGVGVTVILPRMGWVGPPSASALGAAALAAVAIALLAAPAVAATRRAPGRAAGAPSTWPSLAPAVVSGLTVDSLDVRPPGGGPVIVPGLRLEVGAGEVIGLVGANGSGKSSALRAIARAAGGDRRVKLEPRARTMLLPQERGGFPGCSVGETLVLAARSGGRDRRAARKAAVDWLEPLGVAPLRDVACDLLAAGARRRVDLARVLLSRPSVILCDEPLAGLETADREAVLDILRAAAAAGAAVVLCDHDRDAVAATATAGVVELGRVEAAPGPAAA